MAWSAPSHYLNQCWNIVNWTIRNKLQWNINQNSNIFIKKCVWKCRLWNGSHFVLASMCWYYNPRYMHAITQIACLVYRLTFIWYGIDNSTSWLFGSFAGVNSIYACYHWRWKRESWWNINLSGFLFISTEQAVIYLCEIIMKRS